MIKKYHMEKIPESIDNMRESVENRGTKYGRKLIQGITTQKLILGAGSDTMSGQEVTPQV